LVEGDGPGIEENCLYVKDDEDEGKHIIADVELNPGSADGFDSRFVGGAPVEGPAFGPQQLGGCEGSDGY